MRRIWEHLTPRQRWQLPGLAVLMVMSGLAEAMTLGAVLPFLAVIVSPERVFEYPLAAQLARVVGLTTGDQLVLPLTVAFALAALGAGAMKLWVLWVSKNFVQQVGHGFAVEVYRRTLYQPYRVHVSRNSSELLGSVEKISTVMAVLTQVLMLVSSLVSGVAIVVALLLIEPLIATVAFLGCGSIYLLIMVGSRRRLARNSQIISRTLNLKLKALQEGSGAIRDILLDNSQPFYCELYRRADWPFRKAKAENAFLASSPRNGVEALGMLLIAGLAYGLSRQPGGGALALPLLGTLALGAQRLMPVLNQSFAAWVLIRGDQSSAEDVLNLLEQPIDPLFLLPSPPPLVWKSAIEFRGVGFRYGEGQPWVLQDVTFKIPKGSRVGFVGSTGSGKSTTLDLLMGLLDPSTGEVLVDGLPIDGERRRAWQRTIAHVPQHIFLADTTIAENIALGLPKKEIDLERVRWAAQQAQIAEFIESRPDGYWSTLGERGIRLSGGQRQRVGIARALYKQADVLVFDEATSALDNATEQEVMAAINSLSQDLTILMIAHRLSTVEQCDWIVELEQGRVVAQGSYQDLLTHSQSFQRMAGVV
ncbi:MAG: ABC transporter ATP-binding protein [Cyanobacteriota bacterium]